MEGVPLRMAVVQNSEQFLKKKKDPKIVPSEELQMACVWLELQSNANCRKPFCTLLGFD